MECANCPDIDICNGGCFKKDNEASKKEIISKCAELEGMSYSDLMASLMSFIYYSHHDNFQLIGKKKFAFAYALSRSYIEYGCFNFELIEKWVCKYLGIE